VISLDVMMVGGTGNPAAWMRTLASSRVHDVTMAPPFRRKRSEQLDCARKRHNTIQVLDLAALEHGIQRLVIGVGQQLTYGLNTGAPVRVADRLFRLKAVLNGPLRPHPRDRRGRINEDAVKVEK